MNSTFDLIGVMLLATLLFIGLWCIWDRLIEGKKKSKKKGKKRK